ncbi:MAG TPA: ribonuclease E/G, partial [Terriglobia bacterium]|nr:ribonuclease E/G [Terriglobia bacterium]
MQKELIISTTSQETKVAILEDDELVEFYIERHRSQGIVGNIYKGKVTKVLPGMQSAFVDIGLDRDAFLYVSDFFEDTEEYDKIVSSVEDEVAQLQEGGRTKLPAPLPAPLPVPSVAAPLPPPAPIEETPEVPAAANLPPPGPEIVAEAERPQTPPPPSHEDYGRRDRGSRRDRDRRGKKPKIPSFESKSYEPRPDDRTYGTGTLEILPGESLAKHSRRHETEAGDGENALEDKNAPLGAVAEEAPAPRPEAERQVPPSTVSIPPEVTEGGVVSEASASTPQQRKEQEDKSEQNNDEEPPSSARITDRSDKYPFAHRSSSRRGRRGRGGPPPVKQEEHRANGHSPRPGATISELLREGQEILVQVSKEPLGKKGARITSHIALPGRYLVYMPTVDHVGVSRKIASDEERLRLKRIIHENRNG